MALTDTSVRKASPREKRYMISDGDCLYLEVSPSGSKKWRVRIYEDGRERKKTIGDYPDMSLASARETTRMLRAQGVDDHGHDTFQRLADDWLRVRVIPKQSDSHVARQISRLRRYVFPAIGHLDPKSITAKQLLDMLRPIEAAGHHETAHRVAQICGQVFRYGIPEERALRDVSADLRNCLTPAPERHYATIINPDQIGGLMRAIETLTSSTVRTALLLQAYTFVRPGELRRAEWSEFDFKQAEWRIPPEKMKRRQMHLVPLSHQVIELLRGWETVTGNGQFLFSSTRTSTRPMSDCTVNAALRRLGYSGDEMTGHGFRAMASTRLNEAQWLPDAIERQLAHVEEDQVRLAYNYAQHLDLRRVMMQWWADWLDAMRDGRPAPEKP